MAAPDRVYRYFTNLKSKNHTQSGDDIFYVRCAKPLSTYIGPLTQGLPIDQVKNKFKIDGILWIKNPDTPHQATDPDITVDIEIEDPENPGQTITIQIDDPDLGDSNRDGFIAYVYPSGENAIFHDIRGIDGTPISNNGGNNNNYGATDYSNRSWSRASKFRYKDSNDEEAAIILNDAGLNRRGECKVKENAQHEDFTFDLFADGRATFYYKGTYTAPLYNMIYKWGIRYKKSPTALHPVDDSDWPQVTGELSEEIIIPRGGTFNFETTPHQFNMEISASDNVNTGDYFYFTPFVVNEEGEYQVPFDSNIYTLVPRFKLKAQATGGIGEENSLYSYLDTNANLPPSTTPGGTSATTCFDEAAANAISDDNSENTDTGMYARGTMYFNGIISGSSSNMTIYDTSNPLDSTLYHIKKESEYFIGPLLYDGTTWKYFFLLAEFTSDGTTETFVVTDTGEYEPRIEGLQDINLEVMASWNNSEHTSLDWEFNITNTFGKQETVLVQALQLKEYENSSWEGGTPIGGYLISDTSYTVSAKSGLPTPVSGTINNISYNPNKIYGIECTYTAHHKQNITKRWQIEETIPDSDTPNDVTP